MRQIKFRAWDKVKEKWYKNVLPLSDGMFLIEDINGYKEVVSIPSFINDRAPNEFAIMQFTGLKDKNGKEVYEGDILDNGKVVKWTYIDGGYEGDYGVGFNVNPFSALDGDLKVIGNIYEHPELLVTK